MTYSGETCIISIYMGMLCQAVSAVYIGEGRGMRTKKLVALAIALVVVALISVLAVTGVQVGKYIVRPVADAITKGDDFAGHAYVVFTATNPTEEGSADAEPAVDGAEAPATGEAEPLDYAETLDEAVSILRRRALMLASEGISVTKQGEDKIRVELPTLSDTVIEQLVSELSAPGHVYFTNEAGETVMEGERVLRSGWEYENSVYYVTFWLDEQGKEEFANATEAAVGHSISIYMDGTLVNTANIDQAFDTGVATIGFSDYEAAHSLMIAFNSGRLDLTLEQSVSGTIPARVSQTQYRNALIALAIALFAAVAVLLIVYKGRGFVAALSLVFTIALTLYFYGMVPYLQFRFAALFGLIAVAAVKLLCDFEFLNRLNVELPVAFTPKAGIAAAFRTSIARIAEYSLVPIVLALVMQYLGDTPVTAFTSVFAIGSLLSFLVTALFTRPLMGCVVSDTASGKNSK